MNYTIFPKNEDELRANMLLSLITEVSKKIEIHGESPYGPERRHAQDNLTKWKDEYFKIVKRIA